MLLFYINDRIAPIAACSILASERNETPDIANAGESDARICTGGVHGGLDRVVCNDAAAFAIVH